MTEDKAHYIIAAMPKIELHLHLEGAFTFEFLFRLIKKYGGDPSVKNANDLKKKFVFTDFTHFIEMWFWKNQFFREAVDFEECAYSTLKNLASQNVIYCELFYSPWDFEANGLSVEEITCAILSGIERAENDFMIKSCLIADIVRDYDSKKAVGRVSQIIPFKDRGVIGIGLGGSEQKYPAGLFKEAFRFASKSGFRLTAHAGEASGAESVWEALLNLKTERIGHGVRAIEDKKLVQYLKDHLIPLEVCIISNLKTKVFSSAEKHPVKYFLDNGLCVSLNSDDPAMFGTTITDEFRYFYDKYNASPGDLKLLTTNALNSTFVSEELKKDLKDKVDSFWLNLGDVSYL